MGVRRMLDSPSCLRGWQQGHDRQRSVWFSDGTLRTENPLYVLGWHLRVFRRVAFRAGLGTCREEGWTAEMTELPWEKRLQTGQRTLGTGREQNSTCGLARHTYC